MIKKSIFLPSSIACLAALIGVSASFPVEKAAQSGYMLERDTEIAKTEPGTHKGGGTTTGHSFFKSAKDSKLQFTKRIMHPGSAIGYHLQKEEEIYYIISGTGEMQMNGNTFSVAAGDAILTLPGSSHGLKQVGEEDLVVIINYGR
jgi:mannose-6-phosphate isomerase-like protein (cupin superfamily)